MMHVDGSCHCGAVTFEAEVDPEQVLICHCTDCQSLSGTAFRTVAKASSDTVVFTNQKPKTYIKIGSSGAKREQGFCGNCGSGLYATAAEDGPKIYSLRVGTLKQRALLAPKSNKYLRSGMPWLDTIMSLPEEDVS